MLFMLFLFSGLGFILAVLILALRGQKERIGKKALVGLVLIVAALVVAPEESADRQVAATEESAAPSTQEEVETPEAPAPQPEYVELIEIMKKWESERDAYRDPASFVFMGWANKPMRLTGIVYETSVIPTIDGSAEVAYVDFFASGGDKELVDGAWKRSGFNRGVYAQFNDTREVETVNPDDRLTIVCKGVQPQTDKESGIFLGIELQNCEREEP